MNDLFLILFFISFFALIIGLIKPDVFSRFIKGEITRKKIMKIFGIAIIVAFVFFGITTDTPENSEITQEEITDNIEIVPNFEGENSSTKTESEPTSTPTQIEQINNQNISSISNETVSQKNAIKKAKSYLSYTAFSRDGLIDQLKYEQFSNADAVYGADNSGANWNEQATEKAKQYMEYSAFSRGGLIEQLKYDKFTQAQAEYGADSVGL